MRDPNDPASSAYSRNEIYQGLVRIFSPGDTFSLAGIAVHAFSVVFAFTELSFIQQAQLADLY